jgi:hypothetical protein
MLNDSDIDNSIALQNIEELCDLNLRRRVNEHKIENDRYMRIHNLTNCRGCTKIIEKKIEFLNVIVIYVLVIYVKNVFLILKYLMKMVVKFYIVNYAIINLINTKII